VPLLIVRETIIQARIAHSLESFVAFIKLFESMFSIVSPAIPFVGWRARIIWSRNILNRELIERPVKARLFEWKESSHERSINPSRVMSSQKMERTYTKKFNLKNGTKKWAVARPFIHCDLLSPLAH